MSANATRLQEILVQAMQQYNNSLAGAFSCYSWTAVAIGLKAIALYHQICAIHMLVNAGTSACASVWARAVPMTADDWCKGVLPASCSATAKVPEDAYRG